MSLLNNSQDDINTGWVKQIDRASFDMMLGVLQGYQYQFPIQSTVRELTSNCLDANSEKSMALDILVKGCPVSKYYIETTNDPMLEDSQFDASYYDPAWLSEDNKVYIDYYKTPLTERDYITFRDYGVGIGPTRILKYFNLGFSTKRLSKVPIGKFGLGGKAGLSVADFFTIETWYNGLYMKFNVYNANFESLIPPYNLDTGQPNILVKSHPTDPRKSIYAAPTTQKNGTLIKIETKKHHWTEYEKAVEKQLMFFSEVVYTVHENSASIVKNFQPKVLYEDEYLIITDSSYFNKPYLVLNRVNYGSINFNELELKELSANIGLKVLPEDVDVSPSRESILWKDNTKTKILERLQQASLSASKVLQSNLNQTDFIQWYRACLYTLSSWYTYRDKQGEATVLNTLASIVEAKDLQLTFPGDSDIKFYHDPTKMFLGISVVEVKVVEERSRGKLKRKLVRENSAINRVIQYPIYLRLGPSNLKKNRYLATKHQIYAELKVNGIFEDAEEVENTEEVEGKLVKLDDNSNEMSATLLALSQQYNEFKATASKATKLLLESSLVLSYEDVEVESFDWSEEIDEHEQETIEEVKAAKLSAAERRKQEGKLLVRALKSNRSVWEPVPYTLSIAEIPFTVVNAWDDAEIYYSIPGELDTLMTVALLCREEPLISDIKANVSYLSHVSPEERIFNYGISNQFELSLLHSFVHPKRGVRLFQIAKDKVKYVRDFKHISKFFAKILNKTLTMSDVLIQWNTARQIKDLLHKVDFLHNSQEIFPKQYLVYRTLVEYVSEHYRNLNITLKDNQPFQNAENQLIQHLNKIQQLQLLVHNQKSSEEVLDYVRATWGQADINDGKAVDLDMLQNLYQLLDWSVSVQELLNSNIILTGRQSAYLTYDMCESRVPHKIPHGLFESVVDYCRNKGVI
ncbi:MAG: hypothetical protein EKK63_02600 [Acinetobacter sp.]|uniref:ATP-binding protein n=1 Tax=Acinetobacter sp. TaxID=472 RepID=UPI000FA641A5|nr:ATP-binding protein [Acinetobacter sp.]RUP42207.1 MAG: hypothetical protein EKK63_02600 [Acinetobacter sp.]